MTKGLISLPTISQISQVVFHFSFSQPKSAGYSSNIKRMPNKIDPWFPDFQKKDTGKTGRVVSLAVPTVNIPDSYRSPHISCKKYLSSHCATGLRTGNMMPRANVLMPSEAYSCCEGHRGASRLTASQQLSILCIRTIQEAVCFNMPGLVPHIVNQPLDAGHFLKFPRGC